MLIKYHFSIFPKSIEAVANTVGVCKSNSNKNPNNKIENKKMAIINPVNTLGVKY